MRRKLKEGEAGKVIGGRSLSKKKKDDPTTIDASGIVLPSLTSDPSLSEGRVWYRSDVDRLRVALSDTEYKEVMWADEVNLNETLRRMVSNNIVFWFNNNWLPSGMVHNGVSGSGSISWTSNALTLATGATSGSYAYVDKYVGSNFSWDAKRIFRADVYFYWADTNCYAWIVSGICSPNSSTSTDRHIGFKLINGTLFGTVADGTNEATVALKTVGALEADSLMVEYTPGTKADFYINGTYIDTITGYLPSGTTDAHYLFRASIYNTAAEVKYLIIYDVRVFQEAV